jgi:hypothetical protein
MHLCLLLSRNQHIQIKTKESKVTNDENLYQKLDRIQANLEKYEIKYEDLAMLIYLIKMMIWERARKQTVYWYSRQG